MHFLLHAFWKQAGVVFFGSRDFALFVGVRFEAFVGRAAVFPAASGQEGEGGSGEQNRDNAKIFHQIKFLNSGRAKVD